MVVGRTQEGRQEYGDAVYLHAMAIVWGRMEWAKRELENRPPPCGQMGLGNAPPPQRAQGSTVIFWAESGEKSLLAPYCELDWHVFASAGKNLQAKR